MELESDDVVVSVAVELRRESTGGGQFPQSVYSASASYRVSLGAQRILEGELTVNGRNDYASVEKQAIGYALQECMNAQQTYVHAQVTSCAIRKRLDDTIEVAAVVDNGTYGQVRFVFPWAETLDEVASLAVATYRSVIDAAVEQLEARLRSS